MLKQLQKIADRTPLVREVPSLMTAMAIAELFYHFHSFTLECIGFLATWYALSRLGSRLSAGFSTASGPAAGNVSGKALTIGGRE